MEKKPIYTKEIHAERLRELLYQKGAGLPINSFLSRCPAASSSSRGNVDLSSWGDETHACNTCREFIGLDAVFRFVCPCDVFSKEEVLARAYKTLQEWDERDNTKQPPSGRRIE